MMLTNYPQGEGQRSINHRILRSLPRESLDRLLSYVHPIQLPHGRIIGLEDERVDEIFFIESGLVSLEQRTMDGRAVEVAAIGAHGVSDPFLLCGFNQTCFESVVRVPVSAYCVSRKAFLIEMARNEGTLRLVQHYARYVLKLIAQISACNRHHTLRERICRWLLFAQDNSDADRFHLTHEFLAEILGVQRTGVSTAANELRTAGLIEYRHGRVRILDRKELEGVSCECYLEARNAKEAAFAEGRKPALMKSSAKA